jgi:AcrR family transcriptional regulator
VSKGTIYLYFPNKEELFRQTIRDALSSRIPSPGTPADNAPTRQLLATVARYWQFLNSETVVSVNRLVSAEQAQFPELSELYATEVVLRLEDEVREVIERGIAEGEFREADPGVAARMLSALTIQRASWANGGVVALGGESSEAIFREITNFCLRALAPEEAAFAQADGAPTLRGALNN